MDKFTDKYKLIATGRKDFGYVRRKAIDVRVNGREVLGSEHLKINRAQMWAGSGDRDGRNE